MLSYCPPNGELFIRLGVFGRLSQEPHAPVPQRAAACIGLPAGLDKAMGEPLSKGRVGDGDDQRVTGHELVQPGRCVVDANRFCGRGVLPAESQEERAPPDGKRPGRQRQTKPAERGSFEIELAEQGRHDDLAVRRKEPRRGDGTGSIAREHQVSACHQLLELPWDALAFANPRGFIRCTPCPEAGGIDPAGVDVRRAAMTNQGDRAPRLKGDVVHTAEDTSDACGPLLLVPPGRSPAHKSEGQPEPVSALDVLDHSSA